MSILSDAELVALGNLKIHILRLHEYVEKLNTLAHSTGMPLRRIDLLSVSLMENDISFLLGCHEMAEQGIASSARKILENNIDKNVSNFDKQANPRNDQYRRIGNRRSG